MAKTLGLDIGTTSIGWCLMEDKNHIIRSGVRIFPVGVQEDKYAKSATEESKNAARRTARGIRRGYDRYKLRRKQLRRALLELNMLPEVLEMPSARALYELRVRGLDEKLELKEIGRVLLHLNQRRGFLSNRKSIKEDEKERSAIKLQMNELKQKVTDEGFRTLGEYFFSLYKANETKGNWHNDDEPIERIRKRFVHRSMYEDEFEAIWKAQSTFYPNILTEERRRKIKERCIYYQRPLKSQKGRVGKCRFEPKKRVAPKSSLSFQEFRIWETLSRIRVTDNKRHLEALTLEEKEILAEVLAETSELSQAKLKTLIRLKTAFFNDVNKIKGNTTASKIIKAIGQEAWRLLSEEKREHVWHVLYFAPDERWLREWGKKNIGLSEEQSEIFSDISLEPDYSRISHKAINKMLPFLKKGMDYSEAAKAAGYHHSFDEETQGKDRELENKIIRKPNDEIDQLRSPIVMRALSETIALVNAVIQEEGRPDQIRIEFARTMKMPKDVRENMRRSNQDKDRQREEYREFLKKRMGWADISRSQIIKFELWLEMEYAEEDLRKINASVDIEEFKKFVKKGVKPSDKQKYELWLECGRISPYTGNVIPLGRLFSSDIEIEHILPYSRTFDNSFRNKTLSEREFNAIKGKQTPFEYFKSRPAELKAFKERIKGLPIGKQKRMLQEEFDEDFRAGSIESTAWIAKEARNILRRICLDVRATDGQVTSLLRRYWGLNKILNLTGENEKSRNDHRHHAVDAFVIANTNDWWISLLSQASAFDANGRQSLDEERLKEILRTPAGQDLVKAAGLGVAVEDDPLGLQTANPATGEIFTGGIPGPYLNHRQQLGEVLSKMLISYRNEKRLLSSKKNKYRYSHPDGQKKTQKSIAVRGALHAESVFGVIHNPHTGEENYIKREPIGSFDKMEQLKYIVDPAIHEIIRAHVEANGGPQKMKDAMQLPIFILSKDGKKKIPIHSVRTINPAKNLIQLRPKENPKLFVESGSNYCMAIYGEHNSKKREYITMTFFDAAQRARKGMEIVPDSKNDKPLLLILQQKDLVIRYDNDPDEIEWANSAYLFDCLFTVRKLDVNGTIYLDRHNLSKFEKEDRNKNFFQVSPNSIKVVKVELGILGNIKMA